MWRKIICSSKEVQLMGTLDGGQSFRWKRDVETDAWIGVFSKTVWKLKQEDGALLYQVVGTLLNENADTAKKAKKSKYNKECDQFEVLLRQYLRLDVDLGQLYADWSSKDEIFKEACKQFYGIRMLAQEPVENLFSFICSQNNHISRISGMVEKLCQFYGEPICDVGGLTYHTFPDVEKLADPKVNEKLREGGFGYRSKFIQQSAIQIVERGGQSWLLSLREKPYQEAKLELIKLHGIGPKVADCISLMSLYHLESVPVDTHVYQIAAQHYLPHLRGRKSVTDKVYAEIAQHFQKLYGPLAGWAHTVLFCADLKKFQQCSVEENKTKNKRKKK